MHSDFIIFLKMKNDFHRFLCKFSLEGKKKYVSENALHEPQSSVQEPSAFIGGLYGKMTVFRCLGELEDSSYLGFVREGAATFRSNQLRGCI